MATVPQLPIPTKLKASALITHTLSYAIPPIKQNEPKQKCCHTLSHPKSKTYNINVYFENVVNLHITGSGIIPDSYHTQKSGWLVDYVSVLKEPKYKGNSRQALIKGKFYMQFGHKP